MHVLCIVYVFWFSDDVCVLSACGTAAVVSLRGDSNLLSGAPLIETSEQLPGLPVQPKHTSSSNTAVASSLGSEIDPKPLSTTPQPAVTQKHDVSY